MSESLTLSQRIAQDGITATAEASDGPVPADYMSGSSAWTVTLTMGDRSMVIPFYTGPAVDMGDLLPLAVDAVVSDAASVENASGFDDWASEYSADLDTPEGRRSARETWRALLAQREAVRTFLGDHYDAYLWETDNDV